MYDFKKGGGEMKRNGILMIRTGVAGGLSLALALCASATAGMPVREPAETSPTRVLLESVYRLGIGSQVSERAKALVRGLDVSDVVEVEVAIDAFRLGLGEHIRLALGDVFGGSARELFGTFVEQFTEAEAASDLAFLVRVTELSDLEVVTPVETYDALRTIVIGDWLKADVAAAVAFLVDVQTWLDLRERNADVPSLRDWLDRGRPVQVEAVAEPERESVRRRNPLRDAEAKANPFEGVDDADGGSLDQFGAARAERRRKAMDEARSGMQQVAEERRTAEEEAASRKLAAAQAEAEAVRKHAERLAAAESDAIEQRRNSWGNRLKSVLTTTIGATSGAFLGNIGSRAGEAAAEAVFNTEGSHRHRR